MRIAIIGIRGIPVVYSGFEMFAEKLSTELVRRGHNVSVYCRSPYVNKNKMYNGISLVTLPAIKSKNFETFFHSLISTIHVCLFTKVDVVIYLGVGSAIFSILPRLIGIKTAINVDGFDWKREKWGIVGKIFLFFSELLSVYFPNIIITDSLYVGKYFLDKYNNKTQYIPYGFTNVRKDKKSVLKSFNLKKKQYIVWVGRLVPENHVDELIKAYKQIDTLYKCVVIGDDLYESRYKKTITLLGKEKIVFTGFLSLEECNYLIKNAFLYVETKRSAGSHPSLIQAAGSDVIILSNDCISNKQILRNYAYYYKPSNKGDLVNQIKSILNNNPTHLKAISHALRQRILKQYQWSLIIDRYEKVFINLVNGT